MDSKPTKCALDRPRSALLKRAAIACMSDWLEFFRARIDDRPQRRAVLDALHLGGETALLADPLLHGLRIVRDQVGGAGVARHLRSERQAGVVIGEMESEARPRRDANAVERDDAQDQRAGGIADAVDDHALAAVADRGVFGLVLIDQPTMVA